MTKRTMPTLVNIAKDGALRSIDAATFTCAEFDVEKGRLFFDFHNTKGSPQRFYFEDDGIGGITPLKLRKAKVPLVRFPLRDESGKITHDYYLNAAAVTCVDVSPIDENGRVEVAIGIKGFGLLQSGYSTPLDVEDLVSTMREVRPLKEYRAGTDYRGVNSPTHSSRGGEGAALYIDPASVTKIDEQPTGDIRLDFATAGVLDVRLPKSKPAETSSDALGIAPDDPDFFENYREKFNEAQRDHEAAKKAASKKITHDLAEGNSDLLLIPHPTQPLYINLGAYDIGQAYVRDDKDGGATLFVDKLETPASPYSDHLIWMGFDRMEDAKKAFAVLTGEEELPRARPVTKPPYPGNR